MAVLPALSNSVGIAKRLTMSRFSRALVFSWSTLAGVLITTKGRPPIGALFLAPTAIFAISLGVYLLNDIFDSDIDKINAPNRPIPSHVVTSRNTSLFVALLFLAGISITYFLGPLALIIAAAEIALGISYSMRPINLKDRFLIKTLAIGAGGVLANLFGGAAIGIFNPILFYCAVMFVIFLFATSPINDLADYAGDKQSRRRTIPIVIGPTRTVELSIFASITPFVSAVVLSRFIDLNVVAIFLLSVLAARSIQLLWPLLNKGADVNLVRSNHKKMVVLHLLLQGAIIIGALAI